MMLKSIGLVFGHASHTGLVREVNEDSYLVLAPPGVSPPVEALFLVADGVGGTNAGEVASGVLVESFRRWFGENSYRDQVHYSPDHPDYFIAALKDLLEQVNERLYQMAAQRVEWASMGTTATIALLSNGRLYLGHVGDTRAYLLRDGALRQLTADHSWVAEEVAAGRLTEAQAQAHPRRNVVVRVLGNSPLLRVDRTAYDVAMGDTYVLASDGLTGLVGDEEIRAVVLAGRSPQEASNQLVALANQRGGHDNVTVVVVRLVAGARTAGIGPDGVALQSVYLGRGPAALPDARTRPPARPVGPNQRGRRAQSAGSPRRPRRFARGLLLFVALALVGGALALAVFIVVGDALRFTLGGWTVEPALVAGLLTLAAVIFGFLVGYLGLKWISEQTD